MIGYVRLWTWWIMEQIGSGWVLESHVRPIDDWVEHEFSADCVCGPSLEEYEETGNILVIHHSLDGREEFEDAEDDEDE